MNATLAFVPPRITATLAFVRTLSVTSVMLVRPTDDGLVLVDGLEMLDTLEMTE